MDKEECQYCEYRKYLPLLIFLIPFYFISVTAENFLFDIPVCVRELKEIEPDLYRVYGYALDDFWHYNFGKNIDCTVFWSEPCLIGSCLTSVDFKSGTLTEELIEAKRYWED